MQMVSLVVSLSTSPKLRYWRRFALLMFISVIAALIVSALLISQLRTADGRHPSTVFIGAVYLVVVLLFLAPALITVARRDHRLRVLTSRYPGSKPFAVFLLPEIRAFIDSHGPRTVHLIEQTAIVCISKGSVAFWSGSGPFEILCEINASEVSEVKQSAFDRYQSIAVRSSDASYFQLVLCGHGFGIDEKSTPKLLAELTEATAHQAN
jgi:hypothetical protein